MTRPTDSSKDKNNKSTVVSTPTLPLPMVPTNELMEDIGMMPEVFVEEGELPADAAVSAVLVVIMALDWMRGGPAAEDLDALLDRHAYLSTDDREEIQDAIETWTSPPSHPDANPKAPVVVLMQLPLNSSLLDELLAFASKKAGVPESLVRCNESLSRTELHRAMKMSLHGAGSRLSSVALRSIEELQWEAPQVLQTFSDPDHSFASKPLIWLSISGTWDGNRRCGDTITSILYSSWKASGGNDDAIPPILSRINMYSVCVRDRSEQKPGDDL